MAVPTSTSPRRARRSGTPEVGLEVVVVEVEVEEVVRPRLYFGGATVALGDSLRWWPSPS